MLRVPPMLLGVIVVICTSTGAHHRSEASAMRRPAVVRKEVKPAEVVGRVVDGFGHAIANATVVATPATPGRPMVAPRAQSDRLGRFRFVGLPPGEYVFVALHGEHAGGVSPVMPVERALEVVLVINESILSA